MALINSANSPGGAYLIQGAFLQINTKLEQREGANPEDTLIWGQPINWVNTILIQ